MNDPAFQQMIKRALQLVNAPADGTNGPGLIKPPVQPQEPLKLPEEAARMVAAVAAALMAAGVAVNVIQAITSALVNAAQAGAELTAEDVQRVVDEALEQGINQGQLYTAPPKPPPIYDENGEPYETNELGQYWGPDDKGDWRWLSQSEAREASAALRGERQVRQGEIAQHQSQTESILEHSRQKMRTTDDALRAQELAEKLAHDQRLLDIDEEWAAELASMDPMAHRIAGVDHGNWYVNFASEFVKGSSKDGYKLVTESPGELARLAAKGANAAVDAVSDLENWKSAGNTGFTLLGSFLGHKGSQDKVAGVAASAGKFLAKIAKTAIKATLDSPTQAIIDLAKMVLGEDNWKKAVDPNVPVTERFARAVWGAIDTGGVLFAAGGGVLKAGSKVGSLLRVSDDAAEIAIVYKKAEKVADALKATDKVADASKVAKKVNPELEAFRRRLPELQKRPLKPTSGANLEQYRLPGPKTDLPGYLRGVPEGKLIDQNLAIGNGWSGPQLDDMADFARGENVIPAARLTNMDAMRHIRDGTAVPKPLFIKDKTINAMDVFLGADPSKKGLAGYFKPNLPPLESVPPHLRKQVMERYMSRLKAFEKNADHIADLTKQGKILVEDGVIFKQIRSKNGKLLLDKKPYAGDIDGVYFRSADPPYGLIGPDDVKYDRIKTAWMGGDKDAGIPNYWTRSNAPGQHGVETNLVSDVVKGKAPSPDKLTKVEGDARNLQRSLADNHIESLQGEDMEVVLEMGLDGFLRRGKIFTTKNPLPDLTPAFTKANI